MNSKTPAQQLFLVLIGVVIGLIVSLFISYRAFGLNSSMSFDDMQQAVTSTIDYGGVLLINVLIGASITLFIVSLRWDALRVVLTVIVALIFGYLVTLAFSWDTAKRFTQGEFRVSLESDAEPPVDLEYDDDVSDEFNNPEAAPPLTEAAYRFAGRGGDTVSILAYAEDPESGLDLQVALLSADGTILAESTSATPEQLDTFSRDLETEKDAVIENFVLPADGVYTIQVQPEAASADIQGEFSVELVTEAESPIDFVYGDQKGGEFNVPNVKDPLTEASFRFPGQAGDVVTILGFPARANIDVDVEMSLLDASGNTLASSQDVTPEQLAAHKGDLQSARDAAIENFILPANGIYTVHIQPEKVRRETQLDEALSKTNVAYDAFLFGSLNRVNRWIAWIRDAITLIMLGLAISLVFRANQFSLGAEGQLYFGALVSGVLGLTLGRDVPRALLVPIALLSAATAGFLWGLLPGALKAYLGANELVSTLMLNTIATRFYELVLTFQLQPPDAGYTASDWIPGAGLLPMIVDVKGDQISIAVFILIGLVFLTWLLIQRTPLGYEIRMIGANIKFANYGGVNTRRTIMLTMAISGAIAGLAGAHLAMGIHRKLILNISIGLAFEGVVVALLARNNPLVVPFTGLLYAYLRTGARFMESDANISSEVVRIIQAVIILLITAEALITFFRRQRIRRRGTVELDATPPLIEPVSPTAGGSHA